MQATVREHGHEHRLSGFYHVELGVNDFQKDHAETERRLIEAGRKAVEEDFAEALILGCTMEVGFYRDVEKRLGVPVIDPSIAALKRAEYARDPEAAMRLGAEPQMVERIAGGRGDRPLRRLRRRRGVRQPHRRAGGDRGPARRAA